jgi:hypothetical protein
MYFFVESEDDKGIVSLHFLRFAGTCPDKEWSDGGRRNRLEFVLVHIS